MAGGLTAAETYWIYAIFVAHALTPISVFVTDRSTNRRFLSGQIGYVEEVFHWNGLFSTLAASLAMFALVWCVLRGSSWALARSRQKLTKRALFELSV
jgi:hypothetical protein